MSPKAPESNDGKPRCAWAHGEWLIPYHDTEWGVPVHDDRTHFEFMVLEGAQAGLSWLTILKRRDGYRKAFADFDPAKVARFTEKRIEKILEDPGVIRNRAKVTSAVSNAKHFVEIQKEYGSFDDYLWGFIGGKPVLNRWPADGRIPATSEMSETISKDLRARGFRFFGPTVCYAHLQAAGLVMDHITPCFRHRELVG